MRQGPGGLGKLVALVFFGLAFMVAQSAMAQGPAVLGLDQLIQMALERSPEIWEADQDVAVAESDLQQADAARWAQLDATAFGGVVDAADKPIVVVSPRFGPGDHYLRGHIENSADDPGHMGPFGKLEIVIAQPIYTFGKISHRRDAARYGIQVQKAAREKTRGDVIVKVKGLYFGLILAQQGKDAAADIESFVDDSRTRIQRLLNLKSTSVDESDLYRVEAYAAEAKRFKAKADAGASVAYLALKRAIALPPGQEFQLDVKELPKDTRALGDQQAYIQQALQLRPEFEQIDKGLEARKSLVEAAKADMYPSIFLAAVGSFSGAPNREHLGVDELPDDFNHASMGAVLGVKWHFDLGILQGKVNKAQAEYQRLLYTKEFAARNIPIEVAKYYQDAAENQAAYQASEKAATASRKWIVVALANFDMGVGPARDIFFAIERYGKNQGDYLSSLLDYHLALARLSYAIGEYRAGAK